MFTRVYFYERKYEDLQRREPEGLKKIVRVRELKDTGREFVYWIQMANDID
jgi:hypothetical protein